jgi:hypothetical protein
MLPGRHPILLSSFKESSAIIGKRFKLSHKALLASSKMAELILKKKKAYNIEDAVALTNM